MALGITVDQGANALDIRIPTATSAAIGMRNVISEAGALATDIAYRCHGHSPWCFGRYCLNF